MNCRPIFLLIMILTLFLILTGVAAANSENKIYNSDDLKNIGNTDYKIGWTMSANYKLMNNISIDDETWTSIGNSKNPFTGYLNGNGKTITFTKETTFTSNPNSDGFGLFSNVGNNAKLENISLIAENNLISDVDVNEGSNKDNFGILVGHCSADSKQIRISNCSLTIENDFSMSGNSNVGGLIGSVSAKSVAVSVENCSVSGKIAGNVGVGGLVGRFGSGMIKNCIAVCDIETTGSSVGGLIGLIPPDGDISVQNCSAFGTATSARFVAGGLIGAVKSLNAVIENCYASVKTESKKENGASGGLIGELWAGSVKNCYATGDVITNNGNSGGLVGLIAYDKTNDMTVTNCYATGTVTGKSDLSGGLVGSTNLEGPWNAENSFYLEKENAFGTQITSDEMKQIETFENWDITDNLLSGSVWYLTDECDSPTFSWQYPTPPKSGGSGFGQAVVVNPEPAPTDPEDEVILASSEIPTTPQPTSGVNDSEIKGAGAIGYDSENGPDWKLYLILGAGLIIVISGVAYFLNKRNGEI